MGTKDDCVGGTKSPVVRFIGERAGGFSVFANILVLCGVSFLLCGCTITLSRTYVNGVKVPSKTIKLKDKQFMTVGSSGVFYPAGYESTASNALEIICAEQKIIEETLGLNLAKYSVVLHGPMITGYEYTADVSCPDNQDVWAIAMMAERTNMPPMLEGAIYGTMLHERTECAITDSIGGKLPMYIKNPYTRWIGDGLAVYLSYKGCRTLNAGYCLSELRNRRADLDDLPMDGFNLLIWRAGAYVPFMNGPDSGWAKKELRKLGDNVKYYELVSGWGYAMSFAFWKDIADRHGEGVLKSFVTQMKAEKDFSNKHICEVIEKLTGEKIYDRCLNFSVKEAKAIFDRTIADVEKPVSSSTAEVTIRTGP